VVRSTIGPNQAAAEFPGGRWWCGLADTLPAPRQSRRQREPQDVRFIYHRATGWKRPVLVPLRYLSPPPAPCPLHVYRMCNCGHAFTGVYMYNTCKAINFYSQGLSQCHFLLHLELILPLRFTSLVLTKRWASYVLIWRTSRTGQDHNIKDWITPCVTIQAMTWIIIWPVYPVYNYAWTTGLENMNN
jgi:hypothetical protein